MVTEPTNATPAKVVEELVKLAELTKLIARSPAEVVVVVICKLIAYFLRQFMAICENSLLDPAAACNNPWALIFSENLRP